MSFMRNFHRFALAAILLTAMSGIAPAVQFSFPSVGKPPLMTVQLPPALQTPIIVCPIVPSPITNPTAPSSPGFKFTRIGVAPLGPLPRPTTNPAPTNPAPTPPTAPPIAPAADVAAVVSGDNQFAYDLYGTLGNSDSGNMVFSPYSISTALAMTYAGAAGQTATEMAQTLHFTLPQAQLHPAMGAIDQPDQRAGRLELPA